jgi:hypothetical protein
MYVRRETVVDAIRVEPTGEKARLGRRARAAQDMAGECIPLVSVIEEDIFDTRVHELISSTRAKIQIKPVVTGGSSVRWERTV